MLKGVVEVPSIGAAIFLLVIFVLTFTDLSILG